MTLSLNRHHAEDSKVLEKVYLTVDNPEGVHALPVVESQGEHCFSPPDVFADSADE